MQKQKHNQHIVNEHNPSDCYICNELSAVKKEKK